MKKCHRLTGDKSMRRPDREPLSLSFTNQSLLYWNESKPICTNPSLATQMKRIRSTSAWERFMSDSKDYKQVNRSGYGDKKLRHKDYLNSSRTILAGQRKRGRNGLLCEDSSEQARPQSKRVTHRGYKKSKDIFEIVTDRSTDTSSKITGCARKHFSRDSQVELSHERSGNLVQKLWDQKKKSYGILRKFVIEGNNYEKSKCNKVKGVQAHNKKVKNDFCSSTGNLPGSSFGKRENFQNEVPKVQRKKINEVANAATYQQPINAKNYYTNQIGAGASLTTMHLVNEATPKVDKKSGYHRYQTKRMHKIKYNN
ncbi:unnamed protein product [Moneuplotes crassus]|uniref:Uncharacterized protein n=1 Tax=Euplotes crassus TaxID=5936 RepID=A0AAD1XHV2_EUPCR|nr:unnamed protein product [Moneuplotes crassus]